jgi:hypothetical protein
MPIGAALSRDRQDRVREPRTIIARRIERSADGVLQNKQPNAQAASIDWLSRTLKTYSKRGALYIAS